jgi:hypothetical protein
MKLFTKDIDAKLFAQYSKGGDLANQMVVAKIFNPYGRGTWYLLNSDPDDPDYIWAIVDLFEPETGSVSRSELESIKVPPFRLGLERDTSFRPINAQELLKGLYQGKHYAKGGKIEDEKYLRLVQRRAGRIWDESYAGSDYEWESTFNKYYAFATEKAIEQLKKEGLLPKDYAKGGKVENQSYSSWEEGVAESLADKLEISYNDAQGIIEANEFYMAQAWGKGLNSEEAADYIDSKTSMAKGGGVGSFFNRAKDTAKSKAKEIKRNIALDVIDDTRKKVDTKRDVNTLRGASNLVDNRYAKGGGVRGEKTIGKVNSKNTIDLLKEGVENNTKKVKVTFYPAYNESEHKNLSDKLKNLLKLSKIEYFNIIDEDLSFALSNNPDVKSVEWVKDNSYAVGGKVGSEYESDVQVKESEGVNYLVPPDAEEGDIVVALAKGGIIKSIEKGNEYRYLPNSSIEKDILAKVDYIVNKTKFAGNFSFKNHKNDRWIYFLDEYDRNLVKDIPLKLTERIYRSITRTAAISGISPLVKINLENGLVYYVDDDNAEMDEIKFVRKGEQTAYLNLVQVDDNDYYKLGGTAKSGGVGAMNNLKRGWSHKSK